MQYLVGLQDNGDLRRRAARAKDVTTHPGLGPGAQTLVHFMVGPQAFRASVYANLYDRGEMVARVET